MSSIRDDLQAKKNVAARTFYGWLNTIDADDKAALIDAAIDGLASSAIVKVVRAHGGVASKETVDVWRLNLERTR